MLSFLCRCRSTHRQGPLPINPAQTLAPRAPSRCRGERPLHRALLLLLGERPQARLGRCTGRRPSRFDHHGTLAQPQSRTGVDEVGASKLSAMVGVRAATELRTTFCSWLGTIAAMVAMVSVTGRAARSHAWEEVILRYGYSVPSGIMSQGEVRGGLGLGRWRCKLTRVRPGAVSEPVSVLVELHRPGARFRPGAGEAQQRLER